MKKAILLALVAVVSVGCYNATVNTGLSPSNRTIEKNWAPGFIAGLVPPSAVDTMDECGPSGVARVETKLSFLNQLASFLTGGIYTPMTIAVTCAQGEEDTDGLPVATDAESFHEGLQAGAVLVINNSR